MKIVLGIIASLSLAGALAAEPPAPAEVVRAHIDAFNRHDIDALVERVSPDFIWFNVTSDATMMEVKGRDALRASLTSYFKSTPTVRSEITDVTQVGAFVSFRERANWTSAKGERAPSSLAVYEVRDGKIARAWYYPAAP
ncbi:hypothetical protein BH20VER2_BH20VER2_09890 [soil metagenome]|nr:nuclear transport factor 2 family protein [Chthoniobacterales bacterium]